MGERAPRNKTEQYSVGTHNFANDQRGYFVAECTLGTATLSYGGGGGAHPMALNDINEMPKGNTGPIELIVAATSTVIVTTNSHPATFD